MPGSHADHPDGSSFRRALAITIACLLVICGLFVTLGYFQGPKLSDASIDLSAATSQTDPQLRLFTNQAVAAVDSDDVTVTPETGFTVETADDVITVSFAERLRSATDYVVQISGVTSRYEDVASTLEYEFTTDDAEFYYLDRAGPAEGDAEPGQDQIIRAGVTTPERETVVRAIGIQDFEVFDEFIAVATLENNLESAVTLVDPQNGMTERLSLPEVGTIDLLDGSNTAGVVGFTFTSEQPASATTEPAYLQALFTVDLTGDHAVRPVLGLSGEQLDVLDWRVVPGTSEAVVQTTDQTLFRIDLTAEAPPLPLGDYTELGRISEDGSNVVVGNVFGQFSLSLTDGSETQLPLAEVNGIVPFGGDIQLLGDDLARVQQVAIFDDATGRFSSHIVYQDADSARVLYEKTDQVGSIESFEVSPNGQYVAVTTVPDVAASILDGYLVDPVATSITTVIIDLDSGDSLGSVDGFDIGW